MSGTLAPKRKRGRPPVDARYDNWYGVLDPRERKRIQDRLAQRARRKKSGPSPPKTANSTFSPEEDEGLEKLPAQDLSTSSLELSNDEIHELIQFADRSRLVISIKSSTATVVPLQGPSQPAVGLDHWFLCWPAWSIYAALTKHGLMLGTSCAECVSDAVSLADYESLPEELKPTPLQLVVPHRRWIDRFPFPRLRDNMILLSTLIDLESFCADLFNHPSLRLRPSAPSWEARSWVIEEEFASKWGYLFR